MTLDLNWKTILVVIAVLAVAYFVKRKFKGKAIGAVAANVYGALARVIKGVFGIKPKGKPQKKRGG